MLGAGSRMGMSSVSRGVVQRGLGGVGGMSGECEAGGRGLVLCVEAYGLVVRLRVWQRRLLFLGGVIVGFCMGIVERDVGRPCGLCGILGGGRVWSERLRFPFLSLCSCLGVDGLGWSALGGACGGCRCDGRGRMGMVVLFCGRRWVMWEAGVVVRVVQREA